MSEEIAANPRNSCGLCCTKIEKIGVSRNGKDILKDVNLHIHCGEMTALIGPNGAGKSTLLKAILGEINHSGSLHFLDHKGKHTGHPVIGYVPQHLYFDRNSPVSVLDLFCAVKSKMPIWLSISSNVKKDVKDKLERVSADYLLNKKLGYLSGGELQRVLLALSIDPIPDILLLDEPVSGIDQKGMSIFYQIVSELRKNFDMSIILVSHDFSLVAEYSDRAALLDKTILSCGSPSEVFSSNEFINLFGQVWSRGLFDNKGGAQS
ncbi:MAG: metal ABC transporter ATP-binding protein [Deltaproteobacteria bacterium]